MSDWALWGIFFAVGLGTFAMRLSFVELYGRFRVPARLSQALLFVPASVLASLVVPAVVYPTGHGETVWSNPQIPAALLAAAVAWKTRNTTLTLATGMGMLWAHQLMSG